MNRSTHLESIFDSQLRIEFDKEAENHIPSGKLSASFLYQPTRFQILKALGVEQKPFEDYTLGLFARGKEAEKGIIGKLKNKAGLILEEQKEVEYRNVVGIVDAVVDTSILKDFNVGVIPMEIKSMKSTAFRYVEKNGEINYRYMLQGGLYALAMKSDHYALWLANSDDHRRRVYIMETAKIQPEIDEIITKFNHCMQTHTIPDWEVREKWQNNPQYMNFDAKWAEFNEKQFINELGKLGIKYE